MYTCRNVECKKSKKNEQIKLNNDYVREVERGAKCRQKKEHAKVTSAFKIKKEKVETYEENVLKATRKKTNEGK